MRWCPEFKLVAVGVSETYGGSILALCGSPDRVSVGDSMIVQPAKVFVDIVGSDEESEPREADSRVGGFWQLLRGQEGIHHRVRGATECSDPSVLRARLGGEPVNPLDFRSEHVHLELDPAIDIV